jgi:hypothetical protein
MAVVSPELGNGAANLTEPEFVRKLSAMVHEKFPTIPKSR